ncbi:hypothetical protein OB905_03815 [Halobacteria archaeon AArc-dxtr1]|nr:hypothetical protein [Halobacteria archaeon AArc-dxtr1]
MASPFAAELLSDMQDVRDAGLTPAQFTEISRVVARDCERLGRAEVLYFVIGSYDETDGRKDRVIETRDRLSMSRPDTEAFVLEEIDPADEAWENWYVKFRVFLRRATHVVAVFEDNDGGHELEAGEVDNDDLLVLKRDYYAADGSRDREREHDRFDGMLAKLFDHLERRGQLYRWTTDDVEDAHSLEAATDRLLADTAGGSSEAASSASETADESAERAGESVGTADDKSSTAPDNQ